MFILQRVQKGVLAQGSSQEGWGSEKKAMRLLLTLSLALWPLAQPFLLPLPPRAPLYLPFNTADLQGKGHNGILLSRPLLGCVPSSRRGLINSLASPTEREEDALHAQEAKVGSLLNAVEEMMGLPRAENETTALPLDASIVLEKAKGLWSKQLESPQQLANLVILVLAGLYGVSLLLTVDMEVWRGWTWQEIIVRLPYDNWQEYEGGLTQHPVITKTLINIVIYLIGDWMSQVNWGRNKSLLDFDLARTARNGLIGAFFGPLVHYYYDFSDWILPMDVPVNRILKIIMDQSIYFITKCSMYIALVGALRGDSAEQVVSDVKDRIWPVVFRGWRFWPLAHIVTYGVIPPRHRVLWVNMLDLLWSSILAGLASKDASPAAISPPVAAPLTVLITDEEKAAAGSSDEKLKAPSASNTTGTPKQPLNF